MADVKGRVKVYVEKDNMTAMMQVLPPGGEEPPAQFEDAMRELDACRVVFGIEEDKVREALQPGNEEQWVPVAFGQPAQNGADGRLVYKFDLRAKGTVVEGNEDRVDYHDLGAVTNVQRGQQLVQRIPAEPGTAGKNVLGVELNPRPGKDYALPRGKNTVANEDQTCLYSTLDGHVKLVDNKLVVEPVFEVSGDVDFATGNIDFVGDVLVRGNVVNGFRVVSNGSITINGFVEGAEIIADGDIEIKGGIKTGARGLVKAGGSVNAFFIENSRVEAGKDIVVKEAVMQSLLKAGERVLVTDKKASIIGGVVQACNHVEARLIGSQLATQTIIEVGVNPYYREEYQQLMKARGELKKNFENINHSLQAVQKGGVSPQDMPDKKRIQLIKLLDDYKTTHGELTQMEERINFLESEFQKAKNARVRVHGMVYPGVRVTIGNAIYTVNDGIQEVDFVLKDAEVQLKSIR